MSNGTSKPRRALQLGSALVAIAALVASITSIASAQNTQTRYYSGVVTGPDYCTDDSLGGPVTFAFDSDRDGVADTCSLPRTRRATAARQNAMERLGGELPLAFGLLFAEECLRVSETFGEPAAEATDECAPPRAASAAGRILPAVPAAPIPLENISEIFFSGPVITNRTYCLNRSFGGPVTYPFDSDGDGVADICSLPRTRRAAVARQNAYERLASVQAPFFEQLFAEECRRVPRTFGEPAAEATDECAIGLPAPTGTPLPTENDGGGTGGGTTGGGTTGGSTSGGGTTGGSTPGQQTITPPKAPVATNPGTYNKRAAQDVRLAPGNGSITVGWDRVTPDDTPGVGDDDPYDANDVFEYIVEYSTNRNMSGSRQVVNVLNNPPTECTSTTPPASELGSEYACTISGLTNLNTYYVRIKANRGSGSNPYTPILSITPGLAGPVVWPEDDPDTEDVDESLLTSSFYGEIDVTWSAPYGNPVDYYIIQWGTTRSLPESCVGASNCEQRTEASNATTAKITGLNNNTTYYVRIQGVTNNGPGTWSTTQSLRLTSNLQTPGVPTDVVLTTAGTTGNSLRVRWTKPPVAANDPAPTHYIVQWRNVTDRENWSGSTRQWRVQKPTLTYIIPDLIANKQYEARVQAVNSQVAGGWSRTARLILGEAAPPTITSIVPDNRQLTVNWTEPTDSVPQVQSYNLQYNTSSGFPSNCQTSSSCTQVSLSSGTTSHPIADLQDNRIYYVRMQSINANGPGPWSPVASSEPGTPIAPALSVYEDSANIRNLALTWQSSDENGKPDLTGFRVQWRTVGSTSWSSRSLSLANAGCPATYDNDSNPNTPNIPTPNYPYCSGYSYTLQSLTTGRAYEIQVLAVNGYGNGQWATSVTDTPGKTFIPLSADIRTTGQAGDFNLEAHWSPPSTSIAITNYNVQWRTCGTSGYSCGGWGSSRNTTDNAARSLEYPGSRLADGIYYQTRVRTTGASSTGGSSAYTESPRYRVDIDDRGTSSDRTDDTVTIAVLVTN